MSVAQPRYPLAGTVDVVVIGAGHSGLAMSKVLADRAIDHVVLERGEVANSWRHERWDSLRLLTPNWQSRLPQFRYAGPNPHGYMSMADVIEFIDRYAKFVNPPLRTGTRVSAVKLADRGYVVETDRGTWRCRAVVMASGAHGLAIVPEAAAALPEHVRTLTAKEYRNPAQLDSGGVLVVGGSASGLQIADELRRSGRAVTLAVGEHIRMPRTYRGRDIQWWLDAIGVLDERYDEVDDIVRARRVPSPQLVGTPERTTLDLNALIERGVQIVGRFVGADGSKLQFSGSLRNHCAMADLKLNRLLERIDTWIAENDPQAERIAPERLLPTLVEPSPRLSLHLAKERITTIVWATGFRPDYSWLRAPAVDSKGRLQHTGGVAATAGLYVVGLNFMRRRKSSFIHGAEDDVLELSEHLLQQVLRRAAHAGSKHAAYPQRESVHATIVGKQTEAAGAVMQA